MSEHNSPHSQKHTPQTILPVVIALITAYKLWVEYRELFPKETKYTLGEKIDTLFIESIEYAVTATFLSREQKRPFVHKAMVKLDTGKVFLQIAWEIKSLDTKKYAALSLPLAEAGRMFGGWHNQLLKQNSADKKSAEK